MTYPNASRRTFQKVRRDSHLAGNEGQLWRPTNSRAMRLALKAAEKYDLAHKPKGKRNGPLGHVGLEVFRALWNRVNFRSGRLDPSIEHLMAACRRSRCAIVGALKRLRAAGFLLWVRRMEYTGGPAGVRGPQVRQVSNAYALKTPPAALALVASLIVPDDERTRLGEVEAFLADCKSIDDAASPLGKLLAGWAAAFSPNASPPSALNPPSDISIRGGAPLAR